VKAFFRKFKARMLDALPNAIQNAFLSLIVPAGSASADMRFNFENCYKS